MIKKVLYYVFSVPVTLVNVLSIYFATQDILFYDPSNMDPGGSGIFVYYGLMIYTFPLAVLSVAMFLLIGEKGYTKLLKWIFAIQSVVYLVAVVISFIALMIVVEF